MQTCIHTIANNRCFDDYYELDGECLGRGKFAYVFNAKKRANAPTDTHTDTHTDADPPTDTKTPDTAESKSNNDEPTDASQTKRPTQPQTQTQAQEYAVKIYCKESVCAFGRLIENEVHTLKHLSKHPNILQLEDCFINNELGVYLVFEKLHGGDLASHYLRKYNSHVQAANTPRTHTPVSMDVDVAGSTNAHTSTHTADTTITTSSASSSGSSKCVYTETQVRSWCSQLLSAIAHCHAHRIVHRDIKPNNIMVVSDSEDSAIKLVDFGLAVQVCVCHCMCICMYVYV
jgi:serine/threonine protein kinase